MERRERKVKPTSKTYYHGTCSEKAVAALLSGGGLLAQRPEGASKFSRAVRGLSYLSPCFRQASEYAMMHGRADWPSEHELPMTDLSYVFAFDLGEVPTVSLEEDELGWSAMHALQRTTPGCRSNSWTMNVDFANAFSTSSFAIETMAEEVRKKLGGLSRFSPLIEDPSRWRSSDCTSAGKRLASTMDQTIGQMLVDMQISVGVRESILATRAWSFDPKKLRGFMDEPSKADELHGTWSQAPLMP